MGDRGQLRVGAAVGTAPEELERVELLVRENIDVVVIDTAHGDSIPVYRALKQIKDVFPGLDVVVGNVTEPDSARRLIEAGADGIKVGQGPGSICTTRVIAGVGCPQVTAIYHCANAAGDIPVCADGGITQSGDIPIAIGAGAHCVMLGKMLAGTKEAPGDIVFYQSRQQKAYRGMGSVGAMQSSAGSRQRYNQSHVIPEELVPEGVEGLVPYTGELRLIFHQMTAGLRRGMGYVGAASIDELREKADFRRLTAAGKAESHPHDIAITREAPNYSRDK